MSKFYFNDFKSSMHFIMEMCGYRTVISKRQIPTRFTRNNGKRSRRKYGSATDKYTRYSLNDKKKRDSETRFKVIVAKRKMDKFYKTVRV